MSHLLFWQNFFEVILTKGTLKPQRYITAVNMKHPQFTEQLSRELWKRIYEEVAVCLHLREREREGERGRERERERERESQPSRKTKWEQEEVEERETDRQREREILCMGVCNYVCVCVLGVGERWSSEQHLMCYIVQYAHGTDVSLYRTIPSAYMAFCLH